MTGWSGGCQCGAVRYRLAAQPRDAYLCHCRMCQKQFGSPFAALADVNDSGLEITRGAVSWFQSSSEAKRGFCGACGTPLFYKYAALPRISVAISTLDRHSEVRPGASYGVESKQRWVDSIADFPARRTGEGEGSAVFTPERLAEIRATSRQHPDNDGPP